MSLADKVKGALEDANKAAERRDDEIEQAAEKVEPYVHEARQRLAETSDSDSHKRR